MYLESNDTHQYLFKWIGNWPQRTKFKFRLRKLIYIFSLILSLQLLEEKAWFQSLIHWHSSFHSYVIEKHRNRLNNSFAFFFFFFSLTAIQYSHNVHALKLRREARLWWVLSSHTHPTHSQKHIHVLMNVHITMADLITEDALWCAYLICLIHE